MTAYVGAIIQEVCLIRIVYVVEQHYPDLDLDLDQVRSTKSSRISREASVIFCAGLLLIVSVCGSERTFIRFVECTGSCFDWVCVYFSSSILNLSVVGVSTMYCGRLFHYVTVLGMVENLCELMFECGISIFLVLLCLLALVLV